MDLLVRGGRAAFLSSILFLVASLSPASAAEVAIARPEGSIEPVTGMRLVRIPSGTFTMGSPSDEPLREEQETLHTVRLTHGFWIGEREVTQAEWEAVMGTRPSHFARCGGRCPVESVNFAEVQEFVSRLNRKTAGGFRLPTEAEWEYVCRAGASTAFSTGSALTRAEANYGGTAPAPVGTFPPNAWGLSDMHGNVWEWCQDWHCPYGAGPAVDPVGSCDSGLRVIRGGSWAFGADSARCALRYTHRPEDRGPSLGFRVARDEK
jgi:formylglycine-generating enzyme required for sulfatase activity